MEYLKLLNDIICYIEKDVKKDIDVDYISNNFGISYDKLSRICNMYTGMTLYKYIRLRRLTLAANELSLSNAKVCDMAFKYGYSSTKSFSYAFKKYHENTPKAVKRGKSYKVMKPFNGRLKEDINESIKIKIEEISSFAVSAIKIGNYKDMINNNINEDVIREDFMKILGSKNLLGTIDVYEIIDIDDKGDAIFYLATEKLSKKLAEDLNLNMFELKGGKYTVIETVILAGKLCFEETMEYILNQLLLGNKYQNYSTRRFCCLNKPNLDFKNTFVKVYIAVN